MNRKYISPDMSVFHPDNAHSTNCVQIYARAAPLFNLSKTGQHVVRAAYGVYVLHMFESQHQALR